METVVVGLGGSIVAPDEPDPQYLRALAGHVASWTRELRVLVVVGGGRPARRHIALARPLGVPEESLDRIGIAATRLNAELLRALLAAQGVKVADTVPTAVEGAARAKGVVVMGGTTPGHSTDFVAAALAVAVDAARLVNVTNVDGVYTADPRSRPDARRLERLDFRGLLDVVGDTAWRIAGAAGVLDGPATRLVAEHGLTTLVVSGSDLDNVGRAVRGDAFHGTRIEGPAVAEAGA